MMKMTLMTAAALALAGVLHGDELDPLVPFSLYPGNADTAIATMRAVKARSGIHRFLISAPGRTCRIHGCYDLATYEQVAQDVKRICETLEPEGFEFGYMQTVTIKIGENPFTHIRGLNGCESSACPLDPEFRKWTVANIRAVASVAKPKIMAVEDDYQLSNHPGVYENDSFGCFCDRHLAEFSRREGRTYTLDDLRREFAKNTDEAFELRKRFSLMSRDTLADFASLIAKTVHEVSPDTRLGLLECGCSAKDGCMAESVAKALADGRTRPWVRFHGSFYNEDSPLRLPGNLFHSLWVSQNGDPAIERFNELDTIPHETFYASAARIETSCSQTMFYGFDQMLFSCISPTIPNAIVDEPAYVDMYARNADRFKAINALGKAGDIVADCEIVAPLDALMAHAYKGRGHQFSYDKPWIKILSRYGVPYTTKGGKVKLVSGFMPLKNRPREEILKLLSGPVAMDGEAAEFLIEQGYGKYLGVTAEPQGKIDFCVEETADDVDIVRDIAKTRAISTTYMPYGLEGEGLCSRLHAAKGAKTVSWLLAPRTNEKIRAGTTIFENELGGRVAIFALWFDYCRAPNLYCEAKRRIMYRVFDWLGGTEYPRVLDRKNMWLLAKKDRTDGKLSLLLTNLLADEQPSVKLRVPKAWNGGTVEILDGATFRPAQADWSGENLVVREKLAILRPVVVRLGPAGK